MSPGQKVLPFSKLNWAQFEAFIFETLSSGLRIAVPSSKNPRRPARTYRVTNAIPYGGAGHKQKGIDFHATMDDGSEWALQAKLMPKFKKADAVAAVKKARKEFPNAKRYILVVSGIPDTKAIDHIHKQSKWEIWDGPTLTARFLRGISVQEQINIIARAWPSLADQLASEYYPLRDQVLVTAEEFFSNWLKPDRLFHHRSALVGHGDILDQLSAFVADPAQRVAILVAPGGRGKSRLLREFAELVRKDHSDVQIRFVDPLAPATAQPQSLRGAGQTPFVIVQDDAHRSETVRSDVIGNLASTNGKLLLATRPQALAALEQRVVSLGFPSNQFRAPLDLPKLKLREYEALAWAELDPKHRHYANFLARMGRDCPLVITVGASLINRNQIPPHRIEERNFRNEVFARFEGDELNRLAAAYPRALVREVLQTIAVFSPWLEREVDSKTVAGFIGCSESDLQAVLANLESGQLVVQSGRGRRVVPDLFSDHLVYTACYSDDGSLTAFAQRLAGAFATDASPNVLRNLAEADWRAQDIHTGKKPASVFDPFWQALWEHFTASDFMTRARIVEKWGSHSYYQPVRSLELCELAFHLREASAPPDSPWLRGARINSHQYVLDHIPAVLEPIAIFHDVHRDRCLDLLLDLAAIWPADRDLKNLNHPWGLVGRIGSYKSDHPVSASQGVIAWIEKRLADPRFKPALEHPSEVLEKVLSPAFARQFDASFSEGNTYTFRHLPVSIAQTQPMRDHVLRIIENQILPLGEVATLNVLPVIEAGSQTFYAAIGGKFDEKTKRKWQPERARSLRLLGRIAKTATGAVGWKIRTHLRHLTKVEDPRSKFHTQAVKYLKLVPFTGDLRQTAVFCSHDWQEFDDERYGLKRSLSITDRKPEIDRLWNGANESVAREIIARTPNPAKVLAELERIYLDCDRLGLRPNPYGLLNSFGRINPKLAKSLANHLLRKKKSPLHYGWIHLVWGTFRFPDPWLEQITLKVLQGDCIPAISSLLNFLPVPSAGPLPPKIIKALNRWARSAREKKANLAVGCIRHGRGPDDPFWLAVAPHLNLRRLTPEQLHTAGVSAFAAVKYSKVNAPRNFLLALTAELVRVPDLRFEDGYDFLSLMGDLAPRAVFDLYHRRILLAEKKKLQCFNAVPADPHPLARLPNTTGYPQLVRALFKTVRSRPRKKRWAWSRLLQCSVLQVSPLAIPEFLAWTLSAKSMDELEGMASLFSFEGSLYLLRHPNLTLALLQKGRQLDPAKYPEWEARLASTMAPMSASFTNGKRDAEHDYVANEVQKITAGGNVPAVLQSFHAAVMKHDQNSALGFPSRAFDDDDL